MLLLYILLNNIVVYLIVFSITIALRSATHDIGYLLLWIGIVSVWHWSSKHYWRMKETHWKLPSRRRIFAIVVAVISVVVYDWRMLGGGLRDSYLGFPPLLSKDMNDVLLVTDHDKYGRYRVRTDPGTMRETGSSQQYSFLLPTQDDYRPGDLIAFQSVPQWRLYSPQLAFFTYDGRETGQSRQDFDRWSFDYDKWLYMKGIDGTLYQSRAVVLGHHPLGHVATGRLWFLDRVREKYGTTVIAGLIGGMTIGDKSLFTPEWYQQFVDSGLVHLIAVSGGNIALVVLFLGLVLFRVPVYLRMIILMVAIVGYATLVGNDSSVIRAAIMGILTIVVIFPGRQISIRRLLAIARVLMLLRNPYFLLYDLGFLLSFSALTGIVWIQRHREHSSLSAQSQFLFKQHISDWRHRISHGIITTLRFLLVQYFLPTLGATLGVIPLLLWSVGQANIFGPLVNILAVPLVPIITIAGFFLPFIYSRTRCDTILMALIRRIIQLSSRGTQFGLYVTLHASRKFIIIMIRGGWRIGQLMSIQKRGNK